MNVYDDLPRWGERFEGERVPSDVDADYGGAGHNYPSAARDPEQVRLAEAMADAYNELPIVPYINDGNDFWELFAAAVASRLAAAPQESRVTPDLRAIVRDCIYGLRRQSDISREDIADVLERALADTGSAEWHHRCDIPACNCGRCHHCGADMPEPPL